MGRSRSLFSALGLTGLVLLATSVSGCRSTGPGASDGSSDAAYGVRSLAAWPLCEASAATRAPWDEQVVLVADNEVRSHLWSFRLEDGLLVDPEALLMPRKSRPRDIEALASIGDDVLVVGSHSLNSECEIRPQRRRVRLLGRDSAGELEDKSSIDNAMDFFDAMKDPPACASFLFTSGAPEGTRRICIALLLGQRAAQREQGCASIAFEGAFTAPDGRTWLGLRAPQVDDAAVLLRIAPGFDRLRFDHWALVDVGGRGIRALDLAGETLWGIAGPSEDSDDSFALFSLPVSALTEEGPQQAEIVRDDLPTSSEGLVVTGSTATIVVDGDRGDKDRETCLAPSRQYTVSLTD